VGYTIDRIISSILGQLSLPPYCGGLPAKQNLKCGPSQLVCSGIGPQNDWLQARLPIPGTGIPAGGWKKSVSRNSCRNSWQEFAIPGNPVFGIPATLAGIPDSWDSGFWNSGNLSRNSCSWQEFRQEFLIEIMTLFPLQPMVNPVLLAHVSK
jgi:hypothetical protein